MGTSRNQKEIIIIKSDGAHKPVRENECKKNAIVRDSKGREISGRRFA